MKDKHIERVGIFLYYPGSLKFHPSIMNGAKLWVKSGYKADIFKCFNKDEGIVTNGELNVIHTCTYRSNPIFRVLSLISYIANSYSYIRDKRYKALIGIDAYGIIISGIINVFCKTILIYHSLEILTLRFNNVSLIKKPLHQRIIFKAHHFLTKIPERYFQKRIDFLIIQDNMRAELLEKVNGVKNARTFFVPNSPMNDLSLNDERRDFSLIKSKFGIEESIKIVLYAGSLGEWTGVEDIVRSTGSWPKGTAFILHGRGLKPDVDRIASMIKRKDNYHVVLSVEQLTEKDFGSLIASSHIGIVWYKDIDDPNVFYIGAACGKLFYYIKFGIPVVAKKLPGLTDIVENNSCGICVESEEEIGPSIGKIMDDYDAYSRNAKTCFEKYEFSKYYQNVIDATSALSDQDFRIL